MMSEFEEDIYMLLQTAFPRATIFPQHPVKINGVQLFLDFYMPTFNVAIECQGQQHYNYTPHFHSDEAGFNAAADRDKLKEEWARRNKVFLLAIPFNDRPKTAAALFKRVTAGVSNGK